MNLFRLHNNNPDEFLQILLKKPSHFLFSEFAKDHGTQGLFRVIATLSSKIKPALMHLTIDLSENLSSTNLETLLKYCKKLDWTAVIEMIEQKCVKPDFERLLPRIQLTDYPARIPYTLLSVGQCINDFANVEGYPNMLNSYYRKLRQRLITRIDSVDHENLDKLAKYLLRTDPNHPLLPNMIDVSIVLENQLSTKFFEDLLSLLLSLDELPFDCSATNLIRLWQLNTHNQDIRKFIIKYIRRDKMKTVVESLPLCQIEKLMDGHDLSYLLDQSKGNLRKAILKSLTCLKGKEALIPEMILIRSDELA